MSDNKEKKSSSIPGIPDYYGTGGEIQGWLQQNLGGYLEANPGLIQAKSLLGGPMAGLMPAGSVVDYAGDTAPPGWVLCDGSTYDAVTNPGLYLNLWTAIGTKYGAGSQSAFLVPDCRGRVTVGLGTHTDVDVLGETEGNAVANRSYKHTMSNNLSWSGSTAGGPYVAGGFVASSPAAGSGAVYGSGTNSPTVSGSVGGTIGLLTGATRPTNGPAAIVFNKIIKL